MATTVTYVGNQYSVPAYNDTGYAQGAGNLSSYLVALATGSLTLSGGSFPLTADANFGTNFGLVALYLKSTTANIATSGILRLAKTDTIAWRNNANSANLALAIDGSDRLTYNGVVISAFGIPLPIADGGTNSTAALVNGFLMQSLAGAIVESAITISTKALGAISSISSDTANRAAAGVLRLANTDTINWRNNANSADKILSVDTSDRLNYAGNIIFSAAGIAPIAAGGTNSNSALSNNRVMKSSGGAIIEAAAITANKALTSDSNGIPVASPAGVTDTQLGYLLNLFSYRRPVLQYSSGTVVNLETGNMGTSGSATIVFPDGQSISDSTSGHINLNIAQVASTGGSPQSGIFSGSVANNTWYSIFAVKANSATAFVTIAIALEAKQANKATFDSDFGSNSWVYLGALPYGDNSGTANAFPKFVMAGNKIVFYNALTNRGNASNGIRLADTAGATTVTWTYAAGVTVSSAQIPAQIIIGDLNVAFSTTGQGAQVQDTATTINYVNLGTGISTGASPNLQVSNVALTQGAKVSIGGSEGININLSGYTDTALGVGFNPLI